MMSKLNSWSLFWVLALAASTATLLGLSHTDFHSARGMASIVHRSVRCALPLFVLAFTASSLAILWPSTLTRWMLANRRYIGLSFAFAMALHFGFVAYFIWSFGNPLNFRATLMDVVGFIFLLMMTLTSFRWGARYLSEQIGDDCTRRAYMPFGWWQSSFTFMAFGSTRGFRIACFLVCFLSRGCFGLPLGEGRDFPSDSRTSAISSARVNTNTGISHR